MVGQFINDIIIFVSASSAALQSAMVALCVAYRVGIASQFLDRPPLSLFGIGVRAPPLTASHTSQLSASE